MSPAQAAPLRPAHAGIPWRVAPPLLSTAFIMIAAGVLGSLLPLRFSAMGLSAGVIGLIATAEALGFLVGCLYGHKIIAPVGLERAYAAFAGMKAVAILALYFAESVPVLGLLRFVIGLNAAGLAVIVESWLNALVPTSSAAACSPSTYSCMVCFSVPGNSWARTSMCAAPSFSSSPASPRFSHLFPWWGSTCEHRFFRGA